MKKRKYLNMRVTHDEFDLLESIRNYCKSFPDGYPQLLEYAQDLFDQMTDMPKE